MPSHLTRTVFRRLLANEPITHRGCLRRHCYSTLPHIQHGRTTCPPRAGGSPPVASQQRRNFFGLGMFRKPPSEAREANYAPGIEKMMEYAKMERMKARLPPKEDVAEAIRQYTRSRNLKSTLVERPFTDTHAQLILHSMQYCLAKPPNGFKDGRGSFAILSANDLVLLFRRMTKKRSVSALSQAHQDLAAAIYQYLSANDAPLRDCSRALTEYIVVLTRTGGTRKGKELLLQPRNNPRAEGESMSTAVAAENDEDELVASRWSEILTGFIRESDEQGVESVLKNFEDGAMEPTYEAIGSILKFRIESDDLKSIKYWWERLAHEYSQKVAARNGKPWEPYDYPDGVVSALLQWCLHTANLDYGHQIVRQLIANNPSKDIWDAVLVWAAGTKKSVDEIGRMLGVMEESNASIPDKKHWRTPDGDTINALVEYAISQDDPYMAERFISLGRDRGIDPNAKTFVLQMDYRLSVGDVDGALVAYKHLQSHDVSTNEDVPAVNRLVVALCGSQRHDFDTIMNVAADLSDRQVPFSPEMVSALTLLHLSRDEIHDVIDLLNTHVFNYTSADRSHVRSTILAYCLDPQTSTTRSWDAYAILRNVFDELSRAERTELMLNYFSRERSDMSVHVFNHMRTHSRADTIPTTETYVSAFLGCAKLRDLESLEVIHNQLKLDYNVDQTTHVRNALIAAYSACDKSRQALGYWDEIVASREGPTYNSVHIALRACEKSPFGDLKAQEIWTRLRNNKVDLDQSMWASYIAALAGNGDNNLAISQLEDAVEKGECEADEFLLGSLLNAAPGQSKQQEIEDFVKLKFIEVWEAIEEVGVEVAEDGMKRVRIDRSVTP